MRFVEYLLITIYLRSERSAMTLITAELLLLLLLSRLVLPVRKVTVANQTVPVVVMEGRRVLMSCRTDQPWFFCLWDTPGPGHQVMTEDHLEPSYQGGGIQKL